jgi:hypothetical protein
VTPLLNREAGCAEMTRGQSVGSVAP